jgi:hypothetical protein
VDSREEARAEAPPLAVGPLVTAVNLFGQEQELPRDLVRVHFLVEDYPQGFTSEGYGVVEREALETARATDTTVPVEVREWVQQPDLTDIAPEARITVTEIECLADELEVLP